MKVAVAFAAVAALMACTPQSVRSDESGQFEEGWPYTVAPNFPYGIWTSASGYRIELKEDNTYLVCFDNKCDKGSYEHQDIVINLKDFNVSQHPIAQSLIAKVNDEWRRGRDLNFTPNLGEPANKADCKGRPCVQLGNWSPRLEYTFILQK